MKKPKHIDIVILIALLLVSFIFRIYSAARYDFTEDEILALEFNQVHTLPNLLTAPDFDHPPLWYMAMDPIVSAGAGQFTLRFIQMVIFSAALGFSFWLLSVYPMKYRLIPLAWLAINPYVVHLTAGYLMYSTVLGFTLISFCWILRIIQLHALSKREVSVTEMASLGFVMALGLLSDYSFFLFSCFSIIFFVISWWKTRQKIWKMLFGSVILSGVFDIWFLPIFWKNLFLTADAHQWAPRPSLQALIGVIADLFGFVNDYHFIELFQYGLILIFLLFVFYFLHSKAVLKTRVNEFQGNLWLAFLGLVSVFFIFCSFFPNSFFYARVCLTFIVPMTFAVIFTVLSDLNLKKNPFSATILFLFISLTSFSLFNYYQPTDLYYWDFQSHPIKRVFSLTQIPENSCMFPIPEWIYPSIVTNLPSGSNLKVISPRRLEDITSCRHFFYLDQNSIEEYHRKPAIQRMFASYGVCQTAHKVAEVENATIYECN